MGVRLTVDEICSKFPIDLGYTILYLIEYDCFKLNNHFLYCVDSEGYKYYIKYKDIPTGNQSINKFTKFFYGNPYTKDNINNFIKLNNLDLVLLEEDIPIIGAAREKFRFTNSKNENLLISWNQIQHYTDIYKFNYEEIKAQKNLNRIKSKEFVISEFKKMAEELGRPVLQKDLKIKNGSKISIRDIHRYWADLNDMREEIGIKKIDCNTRELDKEEFLQDIINICNSVKNIEHRNIILVKDFYKYGHYKDIKTYKKGCKFYDIDFTQVLCDNGCEFQNSGTGMVYYFEDGEKTESSYEFIFTNHLRSMGMKYNNDYFRAAKYSSVDSDYKGNMNCDYKIIYNGIELYVEIAGFVSNERDICRCKNHLQLKDKKKEEYRQKLEEKMNIFIKNNKNYLILYKDDFGTNGKYQELMRDNFLH